MYYRIKDGKISDYADYEYEEDCLYLSGITMDEYTEDPDKYVIRDGVLINNPDYDSLKAAEREEQFKADFFETSLGWIRRKVTMQDGSTKDFLSDLLIPIKTGLELGVNAEIITYNEPDYSQEFTEEYAVTLQEKKSATAEFVQECLQILVTDFTG